MRKTAYYLLLLILKPSNGQELPPPPDCSKTSFFSNATKWLDFSYNLLLTPRSVEKSLLDNEDGNSSGYDYFLQVGLPTRLADFLDVELVERCLVGKEEGQLKFRAKLEGPDGYEEQGEVKCMFSSIR